MMYTKVPIGEIDFKNDQFQISYLTDREHLIDSIRKIGLIHPVVLRTMEHAAGYQIVSGFQRVQSCMELNMEQIDSAVFRHDELSDTNALLLSLHQTATSREMNLIEKSRSLRKLSEIGCMDKSALMNDVMPLLNLEPSEKIFQHVIHLWKLSDPIKMYIIENNVALSNAVLFSEFSMDDQKVLVECISPLKLGTNRLKEFLTYIDEIRRRDEIPVHKIIDSEMKVILADEKMPTPQKTEYIRKRLKEKRFPKLLSLEGELQSKLRALKVPPEVSLSAPPFLEGEKLNVTFSFKNREELKKIIGRLSDISDKKELESILKML